MPRMRVARNRLVREMRTLKGRVRLKINRTRRDIHWEWARLRLGTRNLLLHNRPISVHVANIPFLLVPKGATAEHFWTGLRFERRELEFILAVLEPGMTFFDIGANAGLFALAAAKKMGQGKVYAFEPCQWTYQLLEQNLRLNGVNNVAAVRTALGDYVGEAVLQLNVAGQDGLNTLGRPTHPDSQVVGQEKVPITTLDTFIEAKAIPRVDAMKVDIEGAELPVFRGAQKLLGRRDAPLILYEGYGFNTRGFGYHPVETMWLLEDCGYSLFALDTATGRVAPRLPGNEYDAMVVGVKPEHPYYRKVAESGR